MVRLETRGKKGGEVLTCEMDRISPHVLKYQKYFKDSFDVEIELFSMFHTHLVKP